MGNAPAILSALVVALIVGAFAIPQRGHAQEHDFLSVGTAAPDFSIPGATRHGILRDQIQLSDYAGNTVVLVFFFRARTRG